MASFKTDPNAKLPETDDGTIVFNVPFPEDLSQLKHMAPLYVKQPYHIDYLHSFGQDSPFFAGLMNKKLLGTRSRERSSDKNPEGHYVYATPKGHCMYDGKETDWVELPQTATVHTFTVCHFGSEEFLPECPFVLALVQWDEADTLFLTRIVGLDPAEASLDWVGMKVKARFKRNSKIRPTDVYFVPVE